MSAMKFKYYVAKVTSKRGGLNVDDLIVVTNELFNFHGKGYVLAANVGRNGVSFIGLICSDNFELCEKNEMKKEHFNMILDSSYLFLFPSTLVEYEAIMERIDSVGYENYFEPEKPISEMTNQELRKYVTAFYAANWKNSNDLFDEVVEVSYEREKEIVSQLNSEFNKRVEKHFLDFYEFFDSFINKEKWGGELRYALLSYGGVRNTNELKCLKLANLINHFDFSKHEDVMRALDLARIGNFYELPREASIPIPSVSNAKETIESFRKLERETAKKNELVDFILTNSIN